MQRKTKQALAFLVIAILVMQTVFGSLSVMAIENTSSLHITMRTNGQTYNEGDIATGPVTVHVTADSATVQISQDVGASWQPLDVNQPLILEAAGTHHVWLKIIGQSEMEKREIRIAPALIAPLASTASIIYVKSDANGGNNGTNWVNAYTDLQVALANVQAGQEIWIAKGTYKPTTGADQRISFQMKDDVTIYGGFAGESQEETIATRDLIANETILSGDIGVENDRSDNSYNVFYHNDSIHLGDTAILDGVTIFGGNATDSSSANRMHGGGMYNKNNSSPTLRNVLFKSNSANGSGGGMSNEEDSNPVLTDVKFIKNRSEGDGGAIFNSKATDLKLEKVDFIENSAQDSGGGMYNILSTLTLTDGLYKDNSVDSDDHADKGGGMYNDQCILTLETVEFNSNKAVDGGGIFSTDTTSTLTEVQFIENKATSNGGALYNTYSTLMLTNGLFDGNTADYGGAIYNVENSPTFTNALFQKNNASIDGDVWYNEGSTSKPRFKNVTVSRNGVQGSTDHATFSNSMGTVLIGNSIIVGNDGESLVNGASEMTNSLIGGTVEATFYDGTRAEVIGKSYPIATIFENFDGYDFRLKADSPAIDKGDNTINDTTIDLAGKPRIQGGIIDLGTYESSPMTLYNITYDGNGAESGLAPVDSGGYVTDDEVTVMDNEGGLSKTNFTFVGWNTEANGTGDDYSVGQKFNIGTANITLYAKWKVVEHTITFVDGDKTVDSQTVAHEQTATEPAPPTKVGHTFAGWYNGETKWNFAKDKAKEATILYAKWTVNSTTSPIPTPPTSGGGSNTSSDTSESTYIVQFQTNGGTMIANQSKSYNSKMAAPPTPVREGYTFAGWYTDSALTREWNFDTDFVRDNMILYAKWNTEEKIELVEKEKEVPPVEQSTAPACTIQFTDIATHWAKDMIEDITGRCIIKGYPDGTFKPNDPIQRQHVAVLLTRTFDLLAIREVQNFTDVSASHKYYDAIMQVYQAGIFDGIDGQFNPDAYMTRAQMAKILVLAFELKSNGANPAMFQDVPATHWAKDYIAILAAHGIALGDNGHFKPDEPVTRAQFVAFLYRIMQTER